jgi:hypothetical protein
VSHPLDMMELLTIRAEETWVLGWPRARRKFLAALPRLRSVARLFEQQPHPVAIEESQVTKAVKLSEPDHCLVELFGAVNIADSQADLPDVAEI